eukprot:Sspe_Gene.79616::Locus_49966_Transcript_1_1_Confidence_1.000_Length_1005::g.79616::m.79616
MRQKPKETNKKQQHHHLNTLSEKPSSPYFLLQGSLPPTPPPLLCECVYFPPYLWAFEEEPHPPYPISPFPPSLSPLIPLNGGTCDNCAWRSSTERTGGKGGLRGPSKAGPPTSVTPIRPPYPASFCFLVCQRRPTTTSLQGGNHSGWSGVLSPFSPHLSSSPPTPAHFIIAHGVACAPLPLY